MQALQLDWRAGPRHITLVGVVLALAGVLCAAWVAMDYAEADAQWHTLQARQARQTRAAQPAKRSAPLPSSPSPLAREDAQSSTQMAAQIDAQIDAQLQRPWDALLHALEQQNMQDVALISLDVQAASNSLHLVGEAKDMAHALAYVKQLRALPQLRKLYLTGQEEKTAGTQKVLRFSLDAAWSSTP